MWNADTIDELRACFECTDWNSFMDSSESIDELVTVISEYINFCVDNIIPVRVVKSYPNQKPWISKELIDVLKQKKSAFNANDKSGVKNLQKNIEKQIVQLKVQYKMKMERNFQRNNTQAAWQQIQTMVGYKVRSKKLDLDEKAVNDLGDFYSRFDTQDFSVLNESVRESMF